MYTHWFFTANFKDTSRLDKWMKKQDPEKLKTDLMRGILFQLEEGSNKTKHFQGCIIMKKPIDKGGLKKHLNLCVPLLENCHLEKTKYEEYAEKYCTKMDTRIAGPWQAGTIPKTKQQGKRNDLLNVYDDIKNGLSMYDVMCNNPGAYMKCHKAADKVKSLIDKHNAVETMCRRRVELASTPVICYWGESGAGKTMAATQDTRNTIIAKITESGKMWLDGWDKEKILVIDEFKPYMIKHAELLQIMDNNTTRGYEVKGGMIFPSFEKIYITSQTHPEEWYPNLSDEEEKALLRRFSSIQEFRRTLMDVISLSSDNESEYSGCYSDERE